MQVRRLILSWLLLAVVMTVAAVPARRQWVTLQQRDGTAVLVQACGDEFYHFMQDADGHRYRVDAEGFLQPLTLQEHAAGKLRASAAQRRRSLKRAATTYSGDCKGLVILVSFTNAEFTSDNPRQVWDEIINRPGYDEHGAGGSVVDYFSQQSFGRFNLTFDVVGPVQMDTTYNYYGKNDDANVGEMIYAACKAVEDSVDFSDYDWNGDGEVEEVFILYAGYGENEFYNKPQYIWPHMWDLSAYGYSRAERTFDGVVVDTYACSNEINKLKELNGIGTFCHEFSHCLGLPDMYNTDEGSSVLGVWDLMDTGCYNGDNWLPAGYSAYERYYVGWTEPIVLEESCTVDSLLPLNEGGAAYMVVNDNNDQEYYIMENRQKRGWDAELPDSGLLITHIDYSSRKWYDNVPNNVSSHLRIEILAADGRSLTSAKSHATYPYQSNDSLTATSSPAAIWYTADQSGSETWGMALRHIADSAGLVSFDFEAAEPVSAIRGVIAPSASVPVAVYDLWGRRLGASPASLPPGLYIIRYANGEVRKEKR